MFSSNHGENIKAQGLTWIRKAAEQGNADAECIVGGMYYFGDTVPKDYAQALVWYRKAADQGNAGAQSALGGMYGDGQGVPQDYVEAHKWYNLSAAHEPIAQLREMTVKSRDLLAAKMTSAQIAKAQQLAREWKPK